MVVRDAMTSFWDRLRERIRTGVGGTHERMGEETDSTYGGLTDGSPPTNSRSLSNDYTELMGGRVPCPSCKGSGKIPRELEETLVALIPINDDRLKPKRTWMWVMLGIGVCGILAFLALYMLMPRSVDLSPNHQAIDIIHVVNHTRLPPKIQLHFMNFVYIANHNYYSVRVVNTSANVISKFQPWNSDVIGSGINNSVVSIGPLSKNDNRLYFNNSVILTDLVAEYCQAPFSRLTSLYVNMQFDIVAILEYFNHKEQVTITTTQQVCCVPSGNCTST